MRDHLRSFWFDGGGAEPEAKQGWSGTDSSLVNVICQCCRIALASGPMWSEVVSGRWASGRLFEHEARETQPGIGFHRARAQSALAGGARARTRFALDVRAGGTPAWEVVGLELWRGFSSSSTSTKHEVRSNSAMNPQHRNQKVPVASSALHRQGLSGPSGNGD